MTDNGITNLITAYAKLSEMAKPVMVDVAISSAVQEVSYVNEILKPMWEHQKSYSSEIERLSNIAKEISASVPFAELQNSIASTQIILASLKTSVISDSCISALMHLQNTISMVNKVITPEIADALSAFEKVNTVAVKKDSFKIADITYVGDKLVFDDTEYDEEELRAEYKKEIAEFKKETPIEKLKKKFWLLCFIFYLINMIPELTQTIVFYKDCPQNIEQFVRTNILGEKQYLNVIKENAFIRDEANSKSPIVINVTYAEQLEVIDNVPYWYKVKYVTEEKEYTGWISKISVGTEADIND